MADETHLGDVANVIMGQSPPGTTYNELSEGLPFFQGVRDFTYRYPNVRVYCSEPSRIARPGDILLSIRAPIGRINIVNRESCIGRGLAIIRPKSIEDFRYLEFVLRLEEPNWQSIEGGGSVFGNATRNDIESLSILWPTNSNERKAIAHVLGTLDDKIELNRRMNQTLEEIAQVLFKSWFVDFDPVRAKVEGLDTCLPQHIADLFPDSFEDSELGQTPKGWAFASLIELINPTKGVSYSSADLIEADTALVTLKSFARGGGYRPEGLKSYAGSYKANQVVVPGEVVLACTDVTQAAEVVGRPAIVRPSTKYKTLIASLDTMILRPKDGKLTKAFLYFLCGSAKFTEHTYAHTTGTTVLHLASTAMPSFRLPLPSSELVQAFDIIAKPLLGKIQNIEQESETLSSLRDSLLPKLISGELKVTATKE